MLISYAVSVIFLLAYYASDIGVNMLFKWGVGRGGEASLGLYVAIMNIYITKYTRIVRIICVAHMVCCTVSDISDMVDSFLLYNNSKTY